MSPSPLDLIAEDYAQVTHQKTQCLQALKNNVIVITGGTGFMGTWLAGLLAFLNDHHAFNTHIILIARHIEHFKSTRPHLSQRHDIQLISADVRYLAEMPSETNWVIHAAGTPDNRFHATSPLDTMSIIANGTQAVLRAVERCSNFKMLLNISSGLIYGSQPSDLTYLNEGFPGAPSCATVSSAYAEAKRFAETLCHASRSQARIPIVTARPFAFLGPYQSLDRSWAINNFIQDAISGNAIRVLGDGATLRSYLYASDMAYWLLNILVRGKSGHAYNVGSDESISLANLAKLIANQVDSSLEVKLKTATAAANSIQNSRFIPDISLATKELQLTQEVSLAKALQRTITWNKIISETMPI